MENKENTDFIATELLSELKQDRKLKNILSIVLLIALVVTNVCWLLYTSGYDYVSYQKDLNGTAIIENLNEVIRNVPKSENKRAEGEVIKESC